MEDQGGEKPDKPLPSKGRPTGKTKKRGLSRPKKVRGKHKRQKTNGIPFPELPLPELVQSPPPASSSPIPPLRPGKAHADVSERRELQSSLGPRPNSSARVLDYGDFDPEEAMSTEEGENVEDKENDNGDTLVDNEEAATNEFIGNCKKIIDDHFAEAARELATHGYLYLFCSFLKLVATDKYPVANIALRLFMDTVKWCMCKTTTNMRFGEQSLAFWQCGYYLFHGKFLRFMSGPKNKGQVVANETSRGSYDPNEGSINFAVPDVQTINKFCPGDIPREIAPGLIQEALEMLGRDEQRRATPHVLSCDGKKVSTGLNDKGGDIDLFGFEDGTSLKEKQKRLTDEIEFMEHALADENVGAEDLGKIIEIISKRIRDLRYLVIKCVRNLAKYLKMAPPEWRGSKFKFAISDTELRRYRANGAIGRSLDLTRKLCGILSKIHHTLNCFSDKGSLAMELQYNALSLKNPDRVEETAPQFCLPAFTKQRTEPWFKLRREMKCLSGSTIHAGIGMETLKKQRAVFDEKIHGIEPIKPSPEVQKFMHHGTIHEVDAVATLCGIVIPAMYPTLTYVEEGVHVVDIGEDGDEHQSVILVSPDGSLRPVQHDPISVGEPQMAVEIKCPYGNEHAPPVHYSLPTRYVCQCLAEMQALGVEKLLFCSWSSESMTVLEVTFDQLLWHEIEGMILLNYDLHQPKKPTRVSDSSKALKGKLAQFVQKNVIFIGEFPSVTATVDPNTNYNCPDSGPYVLPGLKAETKIDVRNISEVINQTIDTMKNAYQVCREKGTELFVFTLSEMNRKWHLDIPHTIPVAYGLKGYSQSISSARKMMRYVLNACHKNGIKVPCVSYDGQWYQMIVRSDDGTANTRLQVMKKTWSVAMKRSRDQVMQILRDLECSVAYYSEIDTDGKEKRFVEVVGPWSKVRTPTAKSVWMTRTQRKSVAKDLPKINIEDVTDDVDITEVIDELQNDNDQDTNILPDLDEPTVQDEKVSKSIVKVLDYMKVENADIREKWLDLNNNEISDDLASVETLKRLLVRDLNVICAAIKSFRLEEDKMLSSWSKLMKIHSIRRAFGFETCAYKASDVSCSSIYNPDTLKILATAAVSKLPKPVLSTVIASLRSEDDQNRWTAEKTRQLPIRIDQLEVDGKIIPATWYYIPTYDPHRNEPELAVYDGAHLLANLRSKICKDGLPEWGVHREAWVQVSEKFPNVLNPAVVKHLLDQHDSGFARRLFNLEVQDKLAEMGFHSEAEFSRVIWDWYTAEDLPGISAAERYSARQRLKTMLLKHLDLEEFPPPGGNVKGMPLAQFEGFLTSVDAHTLLYARCPDSMNQRAVGSQDTENFFYEITEMDQTKLGCPKATAVRRLMATATKLLKYRVEACNRSFFMATADSVVYPTKPVMPMESDGEDAHDDVAENFESPSIVLRDHQFDKPARARTKPQHKKGTVSGPDQQTRGESGVRVKGHYKTDESYVSAEDRFGFQIAGQTVLRS